MKIQKRITWLFIGFLVLFQPSLALASTTLLPNGNQCFSALTPTSGGPGGTGTGFVGLLGTITGGSGGTSGTYGGVLLTGGNGSGATANITVSGGAVTAVAILNPGSQYVVGDILSASSINIGGVTGFSVPISSVAINSSLAGGKVYFYVPNTTIFKSTWKDSNQTTLNQNPVQLDANGCAVIYGVGMYRQVLQDSLGNTVWDAITTDTSAYNSTFWAGISGGTPNAITIVDTGFNATDGSVINFTAIATNTGSATLNPSSYGAIPIYKDTTSGPVSLTGGEIIQSNVISVVYRSQDNSFHLLNPPIQSASGTTAPLCGASGLKLVNGSSPNSIINITANSAVMLSGGGLNITRSNISVAPNISVGTTVSTINGMDGELPGISQWLYVWLIDNGAATAGLISTASGNGLNPTLPSGYIYKCRMGSIYVDGSGNLKRILQYGNSAQYKITSGTNTAALPIMTSGNAGDPTVPTWIAVPIASYVPPTATAIIFSVYSQAGAANLHLIVAPNNVYGAFDSTTKPPPVDVSTPSVFGLTSAFLLESTSIYWANNTGTNSGLLALGWVDGGVNAN